jgi:hypothetical protein
MAGQHETAEAAVRRMSRTVVDLRRDRDGLATQLAYLTGTLANIADGWRGQVDGCASATRRETLLGCADELAAALPEETPHA